MLTNYSTFHGNLWYYLNTDSEHLHILGEPPLATFAQLNKSLEPFCSRGMVTNSRKIRFKEPNGSVYMDSFTSCIR